MSLQPVLNNLMLVLLTGFVGSLGVTALAGFGAAVRLEYVLYPLTFGRQSGQINSGERSVLADAGCRVCTSVLPALNTK